MRKFDKLRAIACEIQTHEFELATLDAAVIVQHVKIGRLGATDGAIFRESPAVRHDAADLYCRIRGTRIVGFLRACRNGQGRTGDESRRGCPGNAAPSLQSV